MVVDENGDGIYFGIRLTTPLEKLMQAYSNRQGVAPERVRLIYDGQRISPSDTPQSLEMEDGDVRQPDSMSQRLLAFLSACWLLVATSHPTKKRLPWSTAETDALLHAGAGGRATLSTPNSTTLPVEREGEDAGQTGACSKAISTPCGSRSAFRR